MWRQIIVHHHNLDADAVEDISPGCNYLSRVQETTQQDPTFLGYCTVQSFLIQPSLVTSERVFFICQNNLLVNSKLCCFKVYIEASLMLKYNKH